MDRGISLTVLHLFNATFKLYIWRTQPYYMLVT
jgi:hypothetical protein